LERVAFAQELRLAVADGRFLDAAHASIIGL
jgi:hypothetical protein